MKGEEGHRMTQIRAALGLTQEKFAERIRVTHGYISSIEQGRKPLNARIAKLIADTFNVNEAWLKSGSGEMFNGPPDKDLSEIIALFNRLHPRLRRLVIKQLEVLLEMSREKTER
jgi:transcriptional regulator with XRE-family HTH domain